MYTKITLYIVDTVPGIFYVRECLTMDWSAARWRRLLLIGLTAVGAVHVVFSIVWRTFFMEPVCTFPGHCGHLVWPVLSEPPNPIAVRAVACTTYMLPVFFYGVIGVDATAAVAAGGARRAKLRS
eukprot:NODE_16234_length_1005_cov_4.495444.p2 GENE.NODE_16234_length_1005_cov_4.495444~~NODE_16234_length_1005_cov_4.495444.p2  ORF type:complete len:125 (+),score=14.10 NODE_16234_length_1005_cov_4.495444:313-687(+)